MGQQPPLLPVLPYSLIVGQQSLKLALELAYIAPRLGGVLLSGHRGTGKSTAVRAFAEMVYGKLPVTLPINVTEDRVVGGWDINQLMQKKDQWKDGLLLDAKDQLLYVDEINLLDDHIVNILLDVTATGKLVVARDSHSQTYDVPFTLVGTMNPEEGGLRSQLLDRFGLMVTVKTENNPADRLEILKNVLMFEQESDRDPTGKSSEFLNAANAANAQNRSKLEAVKQQWRSVKADEILPLCVELATAFEVEGNRGERVLAMAAQAYVAREGRSQVTPEGFVCRGIVGASASSSVAEWGSGLG
jgi:magnesium chelatase subunit I